jgi:hypothetical protein|tara:strand:- start:1154 stop:1447 length:294 start_codon:yes stop_codon:yes gene_type:complete
MKIKSTVGHNLGLFATYVEGKGVAQRIQIVAGSTLELEDSVWALYAKAASGPVESGALVIVEAVKKTDAEVKAEKDAAVKAAKALIAEDSKPTDKGK